MPEGNWSSLKASIVSRTSAIDSFDKDAVGYVAGRRPAVIRRDDRALSGEFTDAKLAYTLRTLRIRY